MRNVPHRRLEPVPHTAVDVADTFWTPRLETNRKVTLPVIYRRCKETGRIDAPRWRPGMPRHARMATESDVAKWIEAVGYSLAVHPDKAMERRVDRSVAMMAKIQKPNGYLCAHYSMREQETHWSNLGQLHELYCAGHWIEAALAYYRATGKQKLLDVVLRFADHIDSVFGRKRGQKRGYCGHPEIELALVKLYRATGEQRYLKLAKYFVDERGRKPCYFDLEARKRGEAPGTVHERFARQAHRPVREHEEMVGHGVCACYLYSGVADVAAETGDAELFAVCKRLWKNLVERHLYITGGIGDESSYEGFGFDYNLPNEPAYAETCASIALVFWTHRMLHLEPDGRYADLMERALYNIISASVTLDGKRFFYANRLAAYPPPVTSRPVTPVRRLQRERWFAKFSRQAWFYTACCPPNIARLLASLPGYANSRGKGEAWVHLYVGGRAAINIGSQTVELVTKTDYPWKEQVRITVNPEKSGVFTLALRIPGWCRGAQMKVNGKVVRLASVTKRGYAKVRRLWRKDDRVELTFPMPVERMQSHPMVRQNTGRIALQRGPVVYCLEEADNGRDLNAIALPRNETLRVMFDRTLLGGVPVITGQADKLDQARWQGDLYRSSGAPTKPVSIKAIPYCCWANRGVGEMLIWLRQA